MGGFALLSSASLPFYHSTHPPTHPPTHSNRCVPKKICHYSGLLGAAMKVRSPYHHPPTHLHRTHSTSFHPPTHPPTSLYRTPKPWAGNSAEETTPTPPHDWSGLVKSFLLPTHPPTHPPTLLYRTPRPSAGHSGPTTPTPPMTGRGWWALSETTGACSTSSTAGGSRALMWYVLPPTHPPTCLAYLPTHLPTHLSFPPLTHPPTPLRQTSTYLLTDPTNQPACLSTPPTQTP